MSEQAPVGIDINGLQDVAAFATDSDMVVGGAIPSVVIAAKGVRNDIEFIAGSEATQSLVGRGWQWPLDATDGGPADAHMRLPLINILQKLRDQESMVVADVPRPPEKMFASAIAALAHSRPTMGRNLQIVVAIPDDGRFDQDAQQQVLNAARIEGLNVQLLWRSVAAVLGMADTLKPYLARLKGHSIAVLSCLDDGISVSRLEVSIGDEKTNNPYVVPKREQVGRFFPFNKTVTQQASAIAEKIAQEIGIESSQVLWGDGLPLRWLLNLPNEDGYFQSASGWHKYSGAPPEWFEGLHVDSSLIAEIDAYIQDVDYTLIEGPALAVPSSGKSLMYFIRDGLNEHRSARGEGMRTTLAIKGVDTNLAPIGCVEFGERRRDRRTTYYDQLPQLQLAVRRDERAMFVSLISDGAMREGGKEYDEYVELGFSIPQGADRVEFYVLREGVLAPRHAAQALPFSMPATLPIRMRIQQTPAQGRAKLTIESASANASIPSISVNWERMEILTDMTQEDIVVQLEQVAQVFVPPVQPHTCHPFLWTFKPRSASLLNFSLADKICAVNERASLESVLPLQEIIEIRKLLNRFQSPFILTRRWGDDQHSDKTKARPISSNGELPEPRDGLTKEPLEAFDELLELLAGRFCSTSLTKKERDQIVTFSTWAFTRCPIEIRDSLRVSASQGQVTTLTNDFEAMGRSFNTDDEFKALFNAVEILATPRRRLMNYHASALFNVLSLREEAPFALTQTQAHEFVKLAIPAIEEMMKLQNYRRLMSICLKVIGGLIRFRLVDANFLNPDEPLGDCVRDLLELVKNRTENIRERRAIYQLSDSIIDVLDRRSVSDTILQWPGEDDDEDDAE